MQYSICIRSLGRGGEKYEKLLQSIKRLNIVPKEVIIAIPHGYSQPPVNLGYERFVYCDKGMLMQRIFSYECADTEFVLLLDDDISFEADLVEKLYQSLLVHDADLSFPILSELLPQGRFKTFINAVTLSALPVKQKEYVKVLPSGGYSYRTVSDLEIEMESESAPGACIFARRQSLLEINLREDFWVEYPKYALRDDTIMFYKVILNHGKVIGRTDVKIDHLDNAEGDNSRKATSIYALGYSQVNFWYRYIYKKEHLSTPKFVKLLWFMYWVITNCGLYLLLSIKSLNFQFIYQFIKGILVGYQLRNKITKK